jgi:hypothetical protein
VLALAVGLTALRSRSGAWSVAVFSLTLVLHFTAVLGVIYRRHGDRAGWLGFALFGWGYLMLAFAPGFCTEIRPQLGTDLLLGYLYPQIAPIPPPGAVFNEGSNEYYAPDQSGALVVWGPDTEPAFRRTGHSLMAVLFALMGALMARWLADRREEMEETGH